MTISQREVELPEQDARKAPVRRILLISPEPWHAHPVSKHHYARLLAGLGHHVLFLEPPGLDLKDLELCNESGVEGVCLVRAPRVFPGMRFLPGFCRRWLDARWLERLEHLVGGHIDTVWLFENSRFFDMRFAGARLKIYHQVDLNQHFHPEVAARTADIVFCTTDRIRQRLLTSQPHVHLIHHGLARHRHVLLLSAEQEARFARPGAHAVYVGNLDMAYLDSRLLGALAHAHPEVNFHWVGGFRNDGPLRQLTGDLANVQWWGQVPSALIPAILDRADILLVAYQARYWPDQASPHKFMEYFASGKVIVATYTEAYDGQEHLLAMTRDASAYLACFSTVLADLGDWNAPARAERRRAFAADNTYEAQLGRINAHLARRGLPLFGSISE